MWKGQEEFYLLTSIVSVSSSSPLLVQEVRKAIITMRNILLVLGQTTTGGKLIWMLFRAQIHHCVFVSTGHDDT